MSFVVGRYCEICELCSQWRALRPEGLGGLGKLDDLVEGPLRLAGRGGRDLAALAALEGAEDVILTVLVGESGLKETRFVAPGAVDVICRPWRARESCRGLALSRRARRT